MKILKWTKRISICSMFIGWILNAINQFYPNLALSILMIVFYMICVVSLITDIKIRRKNDSSK